MEELDWRSFPVLVVDDEEDNLDAFRFAFRKAFSLSYAQGGKAALEILDRSDVAVIVSDQRMPGMSGIEFLRLAKEKRPDAVGLLLTAYADIPVLVDAINSGAVERYVQKPWDSKELTAILKQGIRTFSTVRENRRLREQLAQYAGYLEREQRDALDFGELSGPSAHLKEINARIEEVSASTSPVLIECEPGGEQDVIARAIHVGSPREQRPFVRVTCAAFRGDALERELFGWKKGAFEGAFDDRAGRFEVAQGGTVFLDGLESMTPTLQGRLLALLAHQTLERIGSTVSHSIDVRLVVATSPDRIARWKPDGVLPDLQRRITIFPIIVPPLSQRREDIAPLAEHFLRKYGRRNVRAASRLDPKALLALSAYEFPGNARELENVVERASILSHGDAIMPEHLAFNTPGRKPPSGPPATPTAGELTSHGGDLGARLEDIERRELLGALERCGGNKAEVARTLGIQRTTLYYRLKRLGIDA